MDTAADLLYTHKEGQVNKTQAELMRVGRQSHCKRKERKRKERQTQDVKRRIYIFIASISADRGIIQVMFLDGLHCGQTRLLEKQHVSAYSSSDIQTLSLSYSFFQCLRKG